MDWGKLSTKQVADDEPDAVVVFVGAGEGFPLPGPGGRDVECCGPDYAALYTFRVRQMMDTYRQGGAARVYWMRIPTPRDDDVAEITRTVNASIDVASVPWRAHVRVIDLGAVFTPDGSFREAMDVDGRERHRARVRRDPPQRPGARGWRPTACSPPSRARTSGTRCPAGDFCRWRLLFPRCSACSGA